MRAQHSGPAPRARALVRPGRDGLRVVLLPARVGELRRLRRRELLVLDPPLVLGDRKSTRLNSSHANISYAVFCLKKKTNISSSLSCPQIHTFFSPPTNF